MHGHVIRIDDNIDYHCDLVANGEVKQRNPVKKCHGCFQRDLEL